MAPNSEQNVHSTLEGLLMKSGTRRPTVKYDHNST